jgi:hypothetical protein
MKGKSEGRAAVTNVHKGKSDTDLKVNLMLLIK